MYLYFEIIARGHRKKPNREEGFVFIWAVGRCLKILITDERACLGRC
jgi:hypothetical protein